MGSTPAPAAERRGRRLVQSGGAERPLIQGRMSLAAPLAATTVGRGDPDAGTHGRRAIRARRICSSGPSDARTRPRWSGSMRTCRGRVGARASVSLNGGPSQAQSVSFCAPDHEHREGFVAVVPRHRRAGERVVGHLCLEPAGGHVVEVAVAVADDLQHHGIGRTPARRRRSLGARQGVHDPLMRLRGSTMPRSTACCRPSPGRPTLRCG